MGGFRLKRGLGREGGGSVSEVVTFLGRRGGLWRWIFCGEGSSVGVGC